MIKNKFEKFIINFKIQMRYSSFSTAPVVIAMLFGSDSVTANQTKIDLFAPKNFLSTNLVQGLISAVTMKESVNSGVVVFSQCQDEAGAFLLDTSATKSIPSPVTKNMDV